MATDIEAIFAELPGNDRPYSVYLPAYAAVAWYHKMVPSQPAALEPFLTEVRAYADGPVHGGAASRATRLSDAEREAVAEKMHEYTGLSVEYLKEANLRVSENAFAHELLRAQRKTVGRLDGRFVGPTWDPLQKEADYDPQSAAISAAYAATFLDYYHGELKFGQGDDLPHHQLRASATSGSGPTRPRTASSRSWSTPASTSPRRWSRTRTSRCWCSTATTTSPRRSRRPST